MTLDAIFRPRIRTAVVILTTAGAILAGGTAVDAALRLGALPALAFIGPAVGLTILSAATWRGVRWARMLSLVALGGQLAGIVGTAWELTHGVDPGKASELLRLGVDPYVGLWVNMAYSSAAFVIFLLAVLPVAMRSRRGI